MPGFEKIERGVMRLTLPDGSQIQLSNAMVQALRGTVTATGDRAWSCLDIDVPSETAQELERRGLVSLSPEGPWFVTAAGLEVMDALEADHGFRAGRSEEPLTEVSTSTSLAETGTPGTAPKRVTVHPEVPVDRARLLQWALEKGKRETLVPTRVPDEYLGGPRVQLASGAGAAGVTLLLMVADLGAGLILGAIFWGIAGWSYVRHRRARDLAMARLRSNPFHIIEDHKGRYATGEVLDEQARGMLGRAQAAVDAVLGSSLHREGLLLDEIRNRVVLTDVEWSLARDLYSQAPTRHRIDTVPAVGERSRQAAERARAALAEDLARVESRIRTLESYAERVRAAELEARDRELAAELDAIADHAELAGAVRTRHDESLSALIQAQELALEIAALSDGGEPEGPVPQGGTLPDREGPAHGPDPVEPRADPGPDGVAHR